MNSEKLTEIKSVATDSKKELADLGENLTDPKISVSIFNDLSSKTAPKLRKMVSLTNVYIPALVAEVERLTEVNAELKDWVMYWKKDSLATDQQLSTLAAEISTT